MRDLRVLFLVGLVAGFIGDTFFVSSQSLLSTADDLYLEGRTSGDLPIDDEDGEDDGSGSGSGDNAFTDLVDQEEKLLRFLNLSRTTVSEKIVPGQPQPTADSQHPATTVKDAEKTPFILPNGDKKDEEVQLPTAFTTRSTTLSSTSQTTKFNIDISVTKEDNSLDRWDSGNEVEEVLISEGDNEIQATDGRGGRIYAINPPEEVTSENLWERTEVLAAVIACGVVGFLCAVFLLLLLAYRMKKKDEGSYDLGDTKLSTTQYHKAPTKEFYA